MCLVDNLHAILVVKLAQWYIYEMAGLLVDVGKASAAERTDDCVVFMFMWSYTSSVLFAANVPDSYLFFDVLLPELCLLRCGRVAVLH
jgi:hypothetical protein